MFKQLDRVQISILVITTILILVMLLVPYRYSSELGITKHGYMHIVNWAVIIYAIVIASTAFGLGLYGIEKHLIALAVLQASGFYLKAFIAKGTYTIVVSGIIAEFLVVGVFCGIMFIDKTSYYTGNKKELEL